MVRTHDTPRSAAGDPAAEFPQDALLLLLQGTSELPASELTRVVKLAGDVLGAERARLLVVDYSLVWLHELGEDGRHR